MDGLLIVDKPSGPTSHDVVARVRRILRERRIGHTGTLDPMASGVLPLVVGRATRLARFLSGDKAYDATIRLGVNTDSYDALGQPLGTPFSGAWPDTDAIEAVVSRFRGTFLQQPPAFSAKKVAGKRSYALARQARRTASRAAVEDVDFSDEPPAEQAALPSPVSVTAHAVRLVSVEADLVRLHVECSAGFYIRSLAFDVGAALGTGAHLTALRRTHAAGFGLDRAVPLDRLQTDDGAAAAAAALMPMERMLDGVPAISLTSDGVAHAGHGSELGTWDAADGFDVALAAIRSGATTVVRLLDPSGRLVAMADASETPGRLHPAVVLL